MQRVLIAYFSWSGKGKQVAESLSIEWNADVEVITDARRRAGWLGYLRSTWEAVRGIPARIETTQFDPTNYDLVILGTPVWAGKMSSPIRSYIEQHSQRLNRVAVFVTQGGSGGEDVVKAIIHVIGRPLVSQVILTDAEINKGDLKSLLSPFVQSASELVSVEG